MNLTDNETIKAMECCAEPKQEGCSHCLIADKCISGEINICACVLDLINRKQAVNELQAKEIVELKIKVEQQKADIDFYKERSSKYEAQVAVLLEQTHQQKAEIERLQAEGLQINKTFMDFVNKQIAEAIKEFAELIKKAFPSIAGAVDYMVKEMVGKGDAK